MKLYVVMHINDPQKSVLLDILSSITSFPLQLSVGTTCIKPRLNRATLLNHDFLAVWDELFPNLR